MNDSLSPLAGNPAPKALLVDLARLEREYRNRQPDFAHPGQQVSSGARGHRALASIIRPLPPGEGDR